MLHFQTYFTIPSEFDCPCFKTTNVSIGCLPPNSEMMNGCRVCASLVTAELLLGVVGLQLSDLAFWRAQQQMQ